MKYDIFVTFSWIYLQSSPHLLTHHFSNEIRNRAGYILTYPALSGAPTPWLDRPTRLSHTPFVTIFLFIYFTIDDTLEYSVLLNMVSGPAAALTAISSAASKTHAKPPSTFLIFILPCLLDSIHKLPVSRCSAAVHYPIIQRFTKNASPILPYSHQL